jgi:O-antigen ligase
VKLRDRISFSLATGALAVSVLFVGGALRSAQAIAAVLVAGALGLQLFARRRLSRASPLLVFLGVALGLTALQLVPLPAGVRAALEPVGEALRTDTIKLTDTSPWPALSNDAPGTLRALVFFLIVTGAAVWALRVAAGERGRYALLAAVAITCGVAALVTGVHALLNVEALYGVYEPQHATPPILGPLLNPNHLGSLMALGAVLSIGLAFYGRQHVRIRVLWIFNAAGCLSTVFASLSRGAVLAFLFGFAITAGALIAQRFDARAARRRSTGLTAQLPIAIIIAFGLGIAVYAGAGKVATQLDNASLTELGQPSSKYAAWKSSIQLVVESPWVGVGRGGFEPTFTRVHDPAAYVTFSHLENEYLQAVIDFGIPGALALAFAFGWCVLTAYRRWREGPLAAAALGALAGVLVQSSVDFGIELLGLAVPMTLIAATLCAVPLRESGASPQLTRLARALLIAAIGAAALAVLSPSARSIQEDHDALMDNKRATLDDALDVIQRHPLDYFAFGQAAGILMRTDDSRAAAYINHALTLHPTHPGLHRLVARILIARGLRKQAAVQYALAIKGSAAPAKLLPEILVLLPDVDDVAAALPTDRELVEVIFKALHDAKRPDLTMRWLARVLIQPQRETRVADRLYEVAMAAHEARLNGALDYAEQAAKARLKIARSETSRLMLARVHARREQHDLILTELADVSGWHGRLDEKTEAWLLVCDVHIARKAWDRALECVRRLDGSGIVPQDRHGKVADRLTTITDARTLETTQQVIDAMERDRAKRKTP